MFLCVWVLDHGTFLGRVSWEYDVFFVPLCLWAFGPLGLCAVRLGQILLGSTYFFLAFFFPSFPLLWVLLTELLGDCVQIPLVGLSLGGKDSPLGMEFLNSVSVSPLGGMTLPWGEVNSVSVSECTDCTDCTDCT